MDEMKSVSDLASELNVNRQAIFYHQKKLGMTFKDIGGKMHMTAEQEQEILKHMNVQPEKKKENSTRHDLIDRLSKAEVMLEEREKLIKAHEERINDKNNVIEQLKAQVEVLNAHLKDAHTLVRNQQSLMLESKEKPVEASYTDVKERQNDSEVKREESVESDGKRGKGLFSRIFN